MKQLSMISPQVEHIKKFKHTRKNEALMKQCFRHGYSMGMVSHETMQKVENTDYVKNASHI